MVTLWVGEQITKSSDVINKLIHLGKVRASCSEYLGGLQQSILFNYIPLFRGSWESGYMNLIINMKRSLILASGPI